MKLGSKRKEDAIRLLKLRDLVNYHKASGRDTEKLEGRIAKHLTFFARRKMGDSTLGDKEQRGARVRHARGSAGPAEGAAGRAAACPAASHTTCVGRRYGTWCVVACLNASQ